jgi:hypothetical protein
VSYSAELREMIKGFSHEFAEDSIQAFLVLIEEKDFTDVDYDDFLALMVHIHVINRIYTYELDRMPIFNPADLQSMLRTLGVHVTFDEMALFLKLKQEHITPSTATAQQLWELLGAVRTASTKLREATKRLRLKERVEKGLQVKHEYHPEYSWVHAEAWSKIQTSVQADVGLQTVLMACRDLGITFDDAEFPPSNASLFPTQPNRCSRIVWKRLYELFPEGTFATFIRGPEEGRIVQGALGDAWFLSALSVLVCTGYENLEKLFVSCEPKHGIYQLRFHKDGQWRIVTIDDRIPVDAETNTPIFSRCRNPAEVWVQLVEKAYAKLHGSYEAIEAGHICDALTDLTSEYAGEVQLKPDPLEVAEQLRVATQGGFLCGLARIEPDATGTYSNDGILTNHAYGVVGVYHEAAPGVTLVRTRSVWTDREWTGRWAAKSRDWLPDIVQRVQPNFDDEDTFHVDSADVAKQFNTIYTVRLGMEPRWTKYEFQSEWSTGTASAGGCVNFDSWVQNPQWKVLSHANLPNRILVSVRQPDAKLRQILRNSGEVAYNSIGVFVLRMSKPEESFKLEKAGTSDLVILSTYLTARENTIEFDAEPGVAYAVVPSSFEPNIDSRFFLRIYTQYVAEVSELRGARPAAIARGVWSHSQNTAGGSVDHPTWRDNPQFVLRIARDGKYKISIQQPAIEPLPPIGFVIFKAEPDLRPKLHLTDFVLVPREYMATQNVATEVRLSAGDYNLMICCEKPSYANSFSVEVTSPETGFTIEPCAAFPRTTFIGQWTPQTAGGCKNHPTWTANPFVLLTLGSKQTVTLVLGYTEASKDSNVGYYVHAATPEFQLGALLTKSKFTANASSETFRLAAGQYIVVPTTFAPGVAKKFFVTAFSDNNDISMSAIAKPL